MNKRNKLGLFLAGILSGVALTVCLGAGGEQKQDFSRVHLTSMIGGNTAFFDAATGKTYVYDEYLVNCVSIREATVLGEPLRRIKN